MRSICCCLQFLEERRVSGPQGQRLPGPGHLFGWRSLAEATVVYHHGGEEFQALQGRRALTLAGFSFFPSGAPSRSPLSIVGLPSVF